MCLLQYLLRLSVLKSTSLIIIIIIIIIIKYILQFCDFNLSHLQYTISYQFK